MITEEMARRHLQALHEEGSSLVEEFEAEQRERLRLYGRREPKKSEQLVVVIRDFSRGQRKKQEKEAAQSPEPPPEKTRFGERYQSWYTRTLPLMKQLAPDRYAEFQTFYMEDPRYSWRTSGTHSIREYLQGQHGGEAAERTVLGFKNQLAILQAVSDRMAWSTLESEDHQIRGQQLALLETARKLIKTNECAAGVIAASVLSAFLKQLAAKHHLKFRKLSPPPSELVDALKQAKVLDGQVWSQATWLAGIHDRCLAAGESPTKLQVRDLIDGTRWLLANIF